MKKIITIVIILLGSYNIKAQQLSAPLVTQEQDQWCWDGCSTCILKYYGFNVTQCQVAEYARTVSTFVNFGNVNCCIDPLQGCNQPNYNWGADGSIDDILLHFGQITCGHAQTLPLSTIQNNVAHNHLMVYHWSWYPIGQGGGHFVVGTGVSGSNTYYMNPWPGEGYKMSTYNNLVDDGIHSYDATNSVQSPTSVPLPTVMATTEAIYPNPSTGGVFARNANEINVYNSLGALVYSKNIIPSDKGDFVDLGSLAKGIYFVSLAEGNNKNYTKLILQ